MRRPALVLLALALAAGLVALALWTREPPRPAPPAPPSGPAGVPGGPAVGPGADAVRPADGAPPPAAGEIRGTVLAEDGGAVPGARVRVLDRIDTPPGATAFVSGTEFVARGFGVVADLEFSAPGCGTETYRGVYGGTRDLRVVLRPAGSIAGEAVSVEDGGAVAGVGVWLSVAGRLTGKEAVTDDAGRFAFRDVPPGPRVLSLGEAGADGWFLEPTPVRVAPGEEARVTLRLARGTPVRFALSDRPGAFPGPYEVHVSQKAARGWGATARTATVRVDAAGTEAASPACFGPGTAYLSLRAPWGGWVRLGELALPIPDGPPPSFLLPAVTVLTGEIVGRDGGVVAETGYVRATPLAGDTVYGSGALAKGGRFTLPDLRAGRYRVEGSVRSGARTGAVEVEVRPGREGNHVVLRLENSGDAIEGTVVDEEGRGLPGAIVALADAGLRTVGAEADAEGRFRAEGLAPGRVEVLSAVAPGYAREPARVVDVAPGLSRLPPIVLRRARLVRGTVLYADGTPAAATLTSGGEHAGASGLDGSFKVYLDPRLTVLSAKAGWTADAPSGWGPVEDGMTIVLGEGADPPPDPVPDATVRGRVVDAVTGTPVGGETVELVRLLARGTASGPQRTTGPDGRFEARVGPGRWRIRIRSLVRVYHETEAFDLVAGETRVIEVPLVVGRPLRGRLLDATGGAVADEYVWYRLGYAKTDAGGRFTIPRTAPGEALWIKRGATPVEFRLDEPHFAGEATFRLPAGR